MKVIKLIKRKTPRMVNYLKEIRDDVTPILTNSIVDAKKFSGMEIWDDIKVLELVYGLEMSSVEIVDLEKEVK